MSIQITDLGLLQTKAYINGAFIDANNGDTVTITNPATNKLIASVAKCGAKETKAAIHAAKIAQKNWSLKTAKERSNLLRTWFDLIIKNKEDLAQILTAEQGKPITESLAEIIYGANYIEWFAEEAKRIYGDTISQPSQNQRLICIKQPIGVVACITPWNFPNAMLARKIAPALAAGCTVICKPASSTPLSAYAMAELSKRAGIPAGVINIITGHTDQIGEELTTNPSIRKLSFTGSTSVGKQLMAKCASTVKRTSMELGGNAPFIIFNDANIDEAVTGAIASKFRNAGQTCICPNRIFVQEQIYDVFIKKFITAVMKLKMGNGIETNTTIGPLINEAAALNVLSLINDAVSKGAIIAHGGGKSKLGKCFIAPTVLTNLSHDMRVFHEEIFGPVAPIFKFKTEQEAISMANDTKFGLASYFYSRDIGRVWRVSEALEYGIVGANESIISNEMAPFGGIKESGQGREGSKYGLDDYLEIKYICMGGIEQ